MKYFLILSCSLCLLFSSCIRENPFTDQEFDTQAWKTDKNACSNKRSSLYKDLEKVKDKLIGFTDVDLGQTLGSPDYQELGGRGLKFYYYFIDPAPECKGMDSTKNANIRVLRCRISAVNQLSEITDIPFLNSLPKDQ